MQLLAPLQDTPIRSLPEPARLGLPASDQDDGAAWACTAGSTAAASATRPAPQAASQAGIARVEYPRWGARPRRIPCSSLCFIVPTPWSALLPDNTGKATDSGSVDL